MEKKIIEDVNNFLESVMAIISRDNTTYVLNNTIHYSYIDNGKSCSDSIFIYDKLEGHGYSIVFNSKLNIIRASMFGMKDDIVLSMQDFLNEIRVY